MDFTTEQALETYKSMIAVGTEALKALQLINGGAVVAMLAYLGQAPSGATIAHNVAPAFLLFLAGLLLATLAFVSTYLTQFALLNEFFPNKDPRLIKHMVWLRVTIVVALISVLCFAVGSYAAVRAISG